MSKYVSVSVIVPVYNCERYIKRCLDSLVEAQEYLKDMEVIVVDNHSSDGSFAIANEYGFKYKFIKVFRNDKNYGQCYSMDVGLGLSTGKYVAQCDSDDYVEPRMYSILYENAENCDVVKCDFTDVFGNKPKGRAHIFTDSFFSSKIFNINMLNDEQRLAFLNQMPHLTSAIYRRKFIYEYNLWYRVYGIYEDTCMTFKISAMANKYKYIPESLYYYRRDNPDCGSRNIKQFPIHGMIEQFEEIDSFCKQHNFNFRDEIKAMKKTKYKWLYGKLFGDDRQKFYELAKEDGVKL